jgi:hypothetical protein
MADCTKSKEQMKNKRRCLMRRLRPDFSTAFYAYFSHFRISGSVGRLPYIRTPTR